MRAIQLLTLLLIAMSAYIGMYFLMSNNYGASGMFLLLGTLGMVIYTYVERKEQEEIVENLKKES